MIVESAPWKAELRRLARELRRQASNASSEAFDDFRFERPLFYSATIIRKLLEAWKVTDNLRTKAIAVSAFPAVKERLGSLVRKSINGDIDKEFDLTAVRSEQLSPYSLVSELLHSAYLVWNLDDDNTIASIYVCSFRNEEARLIKLELEAYLALIQNIVSDDVQFASMSIDPVTGKMTVVRS